MPDEKNLHKYPQTKTSTLKPVKSDAFGPSKKAVSENGPHLMTGKGTQFNVAKITKGFLAQDPRPGHTQKLNLDKQDLGKKLK